jgi:adenosylcobinamide kinase/adenosylcobinamide-phosphate guanylyltransferase
VTANRLVLIGGGVRSGKSAFALERARTLGAKRVFIATAQAFDDEMRSKIEAHRRERSHDFETVEEPLALPAALAGLRDVDVVVIDCITLWLSNLLLRDESSQRILQLVDELTGALERRSFHSIIVTNEVGMGVVPETPLGRAFRDLSGLTHQRLARAADEVHLAVLGTVLRIKPGPVEIQERGGLGAVG